MKLTKQTQILQFVLPVVFGVIFYLMNSSKLFEPLVSTGLFVFGMYLGIAILFADKKWLYSYYNQTDELQLITRSFLFMLTLIPLGLLLVTSTGSMVGVGMLLGIGTSLLMEMLLYKNNPELFQHVFLFQLKRPFAQSEINWLVYIAGGLVGLFSLLVLL